MCGIFLGPERSYKGQIKHRGILTRKKVIRGLDVIHEHLPIQGSKLDHSILSSPEVVMLFNGELFSDEFDNDLDLLRAEIKNWHGIDHFVNRIKEIDGFYSFIIMERQGDRIWAFTDPLGKKQLYFGGRIASELRAFKRDLNEKALTDIIKFGYLTSDETVKKGVYRIKTNRVYEFDYRFNLTHVGEEYYEFTRPLGSLYQIIDKAVKNRLKGHESISLLLSGGLDSSIIYHHAKKYTEIKTYCVDNENDLNMARLVDPNVEAISVGRSEEALEAMEMPYDLGSMYPQFELMKAVPTTVVLTGDGADEVFGGYKRQHEYDAQLSDVFTEIPFYHTIRLDRMSMWFTKELRSPFLALDVVGYGLSLPHSDRVDKAALRAEYQPHLPTEIVARPKEALKITEIRNGDQIQYRKGLVNEFRNNNR